ncbi:MAG: DUF3575 domain-containing protein [Flavobacterium sp.]|nr:DUF3575 domain-containing protein [Flavobacterium sp.]
MKKILLSVLMLTNVLYSQEDFDKWAVKLDLVQLVDNTSFPNVNLQAEYRLTNNFSVTFATGVQLYSIHPPDTLHVKSWGIKLQGELRYYINRDQRKHPGFFTGVQLFYKANAGNHEISYRKEDESGMEDPSLTFTDNFGAKRTLFGAIVTVGYQIALPKKYKLPLVFEPHAGIGVQNRIVKNYDLQYNYLVDEDLANHDFVTDNHISSYRTTFLPSFTLGFRIGLQL